MIRIIKCPNPKCNKDFTWIAASDEVVVPKGTPNAVKRLIKCPNPDCQAELIIWVKYRYVYDPPTKPYDPPTKPYDPPTKPYDPPTSPGDGWRRRF